ncbi:SsgA family sporulation/cell division regulator [Streptomyces sp. WAC 00631]|uniref:SsgA family sporulation/cell division regulator n=1 Tax=Streptomyces TaxID=1883 RepID=UPI0004C77465|nr:MULTISPECIES: SsgA family sporulation/cell division regulator [Streptomyces]MCC3652778.1 SsgA family sporulation/cell division regulator [Streptomyces sp. S07_1.15]MCC5032330.1 SsgA family sporulation/cell division regulator [Streptomyces sp. WAC 00631]MCC9740439.1 SsgA family sporulation/cell division regulator [Streptomyces sp. MNU89]WSQ72565.1 SsgA family sporulation/cell division regulator [Streptomyces xinghaiensis]
MRDTIQAELMMSFLVSEELSFRIPVELEYEPADPFAVRFTFHLPGDAPVTWAFARDLLLDGLSAPTGDGDVHIAPVTPGVLSDVFIRLQVGEDRATFRAGAAPLVAFLDRTDRIVPMGQEQSAGDFDDRLAETLDRILSQARNAG